MPATTSALSIVAVLAASLLGAVGQFIFQHGARVGRPGLAGFILNPWVLSGMACYIAVMVLFTHAFKLGGTVRVLYPIYATTFIWAVLIAWLWHGQAVTPANISGMILLVGGIVLMSR